MRNQHGLKLFLVIMISTAYIFSFSHFGTLAYGAIIKNPNLFAEGTKIGSLSVAGKTANEALQLTDEQLTNWLNESTITLKFKEKSELLDLSYLTFDLEGTIQQAKQGQSNPVSVRLSSLSDVLLTLSSSLSVDTLFLAELEESILQGAMMLESGHYQIRIEDYLLDRDSEELQVISEFQLDSSFVEDELDVFVGKTIEIEATSQFSLLDYMEEEMGHVSVSTLSKLATSIYEVILPTNLSIIERHISAELPEYATLGFEAKVDPELNYDLVFSNSNDWNYFIEFEKVNDHLITYLKGPALLNRYMILQEGKESFKYKTILQFGLESKVKVEGKDGQLIKIYREHRDEKGAILKKELISEDFYPPIHQIKVTEYIESTGDATVITPGTETEDVEVDENRESVNTDSSDDMDDDPNSEETDELITDSIEEDSLWGKENEIPK
ncbi:VanW family protein [Robertmurraya massiliosenegalensis]|uniref:VanW family protein n=1 Tax=Robertmurraya TaxID=2837507 RepID=UPI0039A4CCA5